MLSYETLHALYTMWDQNAEDDSNEKVKKRIGNVSSRKIAHHIEKGVAQSM